MLLSDGPIGQRQFTEIASVIFNTPPIGLTFKYDRSHGEFHAYKADNISLYHLRGNPPNQRWAVQMIKVVGYGPTPWEAYTNLIQRLVDASPALVSDIKSVSMNEGEARWEIVESPLHAQIHVESLAQC